jgi:methylenetetrahydrofolate reductase (NADPH)
MLGMIAEPPAPETRSDNPRSDNQRLAALLRDCTVEISPRESSPESLCRTHLAAGATVYINHGPRDSYADIIATAARLRHAGFNPVSHVVARYIANRAQLDDFLSRAVGEAQVEQVLTIGGDRDAPVGPFDSSLQLLQTGLFAARGIRRVGVAGYPEPHPRISAHSIGAALRGKLELARDCGLAIYIVTQFCFEADPILRWLSDIRAQGVAVPVRVGLSGPAGVATLAKFAARCGIGNSMRALTRSRGGFARILTEVSPERVLRALVADPGGAGITGVHFFTFGGLPKLAAWREQLLQKIEIAP